MTRKIILDCKLNLKGGYIKMSLLKKMSDYIQTYKISYKYKAINLTYYSLNISASMILLINSLDYKRLYKD